MCLYILPNSELTSLLSLGCLRCWPVVMDMSFAWWLLCQRVELRQDSLDWQRNEESATETYINTYSVEQDGPRTFVYIFLVCIKVFFSGPNECRNWYVWPTGKIFKSDGIPHNKIKLLITLVINVATKHCLSKLILSATFMLSTTHYLI